MTLQRSAPFIPHPRLIMVLVMVIFASASRAREDPVLEVLSAFHQDGQFYGAALAYRDGKQIVRQAFGHVNFEKCIANTPETRFDIASITKAFTATLFQTRS